MKAKRKKPKLRKDARGEFYYRQYFVRGKMKLEKIYVINGIPAEEFYEQNADPITLFQDGVFFDCPRFCFFKERPLINKA